MKTIRRFILAAAFAAACVSIFAASAPEWWVERGVSEPGFDHFSDAAREDSLSAANAGQLKNIAAKARDELNEKLSGAGGAGAEIEEMVASFKTYGQSEDPGENFEVVNVGQLKFVAKPFFDRLYAAGQSRPDCVSLNGIVLYENTKYPWPPKPADESPDLAAWQEEQFEAATVGQLKYLFSWSVSGSHSSGSLPGGTDGNGNGIPDWWEHYYFGGLIGGAAGGDFSGDGQTVLQHYQNGTAPSRNASAKLSVFTPLEK